MPQDGMSWTHFSTEEFTTAQQQNFRHLFQLEPDSVNVLIMTPDGKLKPYFCSCTFRFCLR